MESIGPNLFGPSKLNIENKSLDPICIVGDDFCKGLRYSSLPHGDCIHQ